jgi:hypothetical protein
MNKTLNNENDSKSPKPESKRPSQKLYVPKHLRNINGGFNANAAEVLMNGDAALNNSKNKMIFDDPSIVGYVSSNSLSYSNNKIESESLDENLLINSLQTLSITSNNNDNNNNSNKSQINENDSINQHHSMSENTENENDWYNLYDDSGECINAGEVKTKLGIPLRINKKQTDETNRINYLPVTLDVTITDEEYGHVIEIYDFPILFKNENIYSAFKEQIGHQNFDIKWVDDNHCLGIFSSSKEALNALQLNNSIIKTRPLSKSGPEARSKAQRLLNTLKPYKARPQTTSFVATRLIGASLGINNLISKEKLRVEKSKLENARTKHKKDKELKEAIWNGQ